MYRVARPFLSRHELSEAVQRWRSEFNKLEREEKRPDGRRYKMDRVETYGAKDAHLPGQTRHETVDKIHERSFLLECIPPKIRELQSSTNKRKIHILLVGDGIGAYAEQIRHEFGNCVEVFSTGLSKKIVRDIRKRIGGAAGFSICYDEMTLSDRLHPNDLKWRSILQLSDVPEFDFIIDTIGEYYYAEETREKYLRAVAAKLLPGGMASIWPAQCPIARPQESTRQRALRDAFDSDDALAALTAPPDDSEKWDLHERALGSCFNVTWEVTRNFSTIEPGYVLTIRKA